MDRRGEDGGVHAPGTVLRWTVSMGGVLGGECAVRVVRDGVDGLVLLLARGTVVRAASVHPRDVASGSAPGPFVERVADRDALVWEPAGTGHAVWWWFAPDGTFTGWYVNLERRVHGIASVDVHDHELDLVVAPDRSWVWKDEGSFAAKTGRAGFWTQEEAVVIRAEGERVVAQVERGEFPFDGTWCDYRPPPGWTPPRV
jgi:hypothetical protein